MYRLKVISYSVRTDTHGAIPCLYFPVQTCLLPFEVPFLIRISGFIETSRLTYPVCYLLQFAVACLWPDIHVVRVLNVQLQYVSLSVLAVCLGFVKDKLCCHQDQDFCLFGGL